jgi:ribosome biogenesis protein Tsr3
MNLYDVSTIESMAAALYDGGWRAADKELLFMEFDFTDEELNLICDKLKEYEA